MRKDKLLNKLFKLSLEINKVLPHYRTTQAFSTLSAYLEAVYFIKIDIRSQDNTGNTIYAKAKYIKDLEGYINEPIRGGESTYFSLKDIYYLIKNHPYHNYNMKLDVSKFSTKELQQLIDNHLLNTE